MLGLLVGRLARGVEIIEIGDRDRYRRRLHVLASGRRQREERAKAERESCKSAQHGGSAKSRLGHWFLPIIESRLSQLETTRKPFANPAKGPTGPLTSGLVRQMFLS